MEADPARAIPGFGHIDFAPLYGIGDVSQLDVRHRRRKSVRDRLIVPIGMSENGSRLVLDMKSTMDGGAGPHGLLLGATASGKSELLQSVVLGLALEHDPEEVNFLLAEAMAGITFRSVHHLPHVVGYFPGIEFEPMHVAHLLETIADEVSRRMEHIRALGNFDSFSEYLWAAQNSGAPVDPLPALIVIIDEFSELPYIYGQREFWDLIATVGRLGGFTGVHLLLASQRLEPDMQRWISDFLPYRICLKTFTRNESQAVLGVPDAYELPRIPGDGFFRNPDGTIARFQAAYSSYPIRTPYIGGTAEDYDVPFSEALAATITSASGLR